MMSKEAKEVEVIKLKPTSINTLWELRRFSLMWHINNKYPFEQRKEGLKECARICGVDLKTVQNWANIRVDEKKDIPFLSAMLICEWLDIQPLKLLNRPTKAVREQIRESAK